MKNIKIVRIEGTKREETKDIVSSEVFVDVIVNNQKIAQFSCSGENVNELITGYLYFHGYINELSDLISLDYNVEEETVHARTQKNPVTEYMNGFVSPGITLSAKKAIEFMKEFTDLSEKFKKTGAVHGSAIVNENGIIKSFDDLSRHNTLFMILGYSLIKNELLSDKALFLTCRLTKSIMDIIVKSQSRMVVTNAAPTFRSVETCKKNGIALAGFVRENRMNIYNSEEKFGQ